MAGEIPPGIELEDPRPNQAAQRHQEPNPAPASPPPAPVPEPAPQSAPADSTPAWARGMYRAPSQEAQAPVEQPAPQPEPAPEPEGPALPDNLNQLFGLATDAPTAAPDPKPEAPAPVEAPTAVPAQGNYKDDTSRAVAAYLAQGGDVSDIYQYRQALSMDQASDEDIVFAKLKTEFPTTSDADLRRYMVSEIGNYQSRTVQAEDGTNKVEPKDPVAEIKLATRAKEIRRENAALIDKINSAAGPTTPAPAQVEEPTRSENAPEANAVPGNATVPQEMVDRVARQVLDQSSDLSLTLNTSDLTSDFKIVLDEQKQEVLKQSVAAYFRNLVAHSGGINSENAPQIYKQLQENVRRMAIAIDPEQALQSAYASGANAARQATVQRYAGPAPRTNSSGSAPNGGEQVSTQQALRSHLKARRAGLRKN